MSLSEAKAFGAEIPHLQKKTQRDPWRTTQNHEGRNGRDSNSAQSVGLAEGLASLRLRRVHRVAERDLHSTWLNLAMDKTQRMADEQFQTLTA